MKNEAEVLIRENTLKMAVCDDMDSERRHILELIGEYIERNGYAVQIDAYDSGEALLASGESYNLVVLDIMMGALSGIETAHRLNDRRDGTRIILCCDSNAFASESYDVEALRYLIKPISQDKLHRALDRYFTAYNALKTLSFRRNRRDESVYLSDVFWIEAGDHKSIIHTRQGSIETSTIFKKFCEQLEGEDFIHPIRLRWCRSGPS